MLWMVHKKVLEGAGADEGDPHLTALAGFWVSHNCVS